MYRRLWVRSINCPIFLIIPIDIHVLVPDVRKQYLTITAPIQKQYFTITAPIFYDHCDTHNSTPTTAAQKVTRTHHMSIEYLNENHTNARATSRKFARTTDCEWINHGLNCFSMEDIASSKYLPFVHGIYYVGVAVFLLFNIRRAFSLIWSIMDFKQVNVFTVLIVSMGLTNGSVLNIVAGDYNTCAWRDGKAKCFGLNSVGQLGYGDNQNRGWLPNQMGNSLQEVDLGTNFNLSQLVAHSHVCALSISNTIKCFGNNQYGQLGYGDSNHRGALQNNETHSSIYKIMIYINMLI
eukprot:870558_1